MPNAITGLLADPRGEMREPPRNKLLGLLADALTAANDYAQKPAPGMPGRLYNPSLGLLADALSLNSLATTAQRASYGEPLTNKGKANVPFLRPETADVAMMAPISPRNALAALGMGMADTGAAKAIFAGIGAKTADKAALAQAEKMAAKGADPKAIWRDTGWFKGGDGKWRFEIDDSTSGTSLGYVGSSDVRQSLIDAYARAGKKQTAGDMLNHQDLYAAYPDMQYMHVAPIVEGRGAAASFSPESNRVSLGNMSGVDARGSMLHELQHATQEAEGFAKGGNQDMFKVTPELIEKNKALVADLERKMEAARQARDKRTFDMLYREIGQLENPSAMGSYRRLAGEAEARAVQSRANLTPQQRREVFPLDSYDVPVNSLIYR